jgi:para-aminobenzoate synthetase/4-amino-4-deoxychorismate lyase
VPIRTAVIDRSADRATYGVGGAVTVGSSPEGEWEELAAKSTVLLEPATAPPLLETFCYEPTAGFVHLDRHLARMAASAAHLDYRFDPGAVEQAVATSARPACMARVRLLLTRDGEVTVETSPLDHDGDREVRLGFATTPISRSDRRLFHKTSDRERYEAFTEGIADGADDVVLWNEEHEVTETTRANLLVQIGGQWWTPPIECGLLPGIGRALALERGEVLERVLSIEDVRTADRIEIVSSLRGRRRAALVAVPGAVGRVSAVVLGGAR